MSTSPWPTWKQQKNPSAARKAAKIGAVDAGPGRARPPPLLHPLDQHHVLNARLQRVAAAALVPIARGFNPTGRHAADASGEAAADADTIDFGNRHPIVVVGGRVRRLRARD